MITINYNGKTYIPGNGNLFSMDNIIKYAIADGNLQEKAEEVKENKEDVLSVKQENPHDKIKIVTPRGETIHINYDFMPSDTSILEKLREELNRRIKDYKELEESVESDRLAGDFFIKRREVEGILYEIISLETKEEPTVYTSTAISDIGKCGGVIIEDKIELPEFEWDYPEGAKTEIGADMNALAEQIEVLNKVVRKLIANQ